MAFDRQAGGHAFDFNRGVCEKCGMTREQFEDNGEPRCKGRPSQPPPRGGAAVIDDDDND